MWVDTLEPAAVWQLTRTITTAPPMASPWSHTLVESTFWEGRRHLRVVAAILHGGVCTVESQVEAATSIPWKVCGSLPVLPHRGWEWKRPFPLSGRLRLDTQYAVNNPLVHVHDIRQSSDFRGVWCERSQVVAGQILW